MGLTIFMMLFFQKSFEINMTERLAFVVAFVASGLIGLLLQRLFAHYRLFDRINQRSSHTTNATRTGGMGVFLTLVIITSYYYLTNNQTFDFSLLIPLAIMFTVGVYDDFYNADFKLKLLLQIIVAKIIIDLGFSINSFYGFFGLYDLSWLATQLFTAFVFIIIVNSINFIDGIDGLAVTLVIKAILVIEFFLNYSSGLMVLGFLIIAALLPLYYFNFKRKNKVFLGDAGSLFLGTLVSIYVFRLLSLDTSLVDSFQMNKALFSMTVIAYPLIDVLRVFILRASRKQSPFKADQNHLHHILLKRGLNHFQITALILLFDILFLIGIVLIFKY